MLDPSKSFEELMAYKPSPDSRIESFKEVGDRLFKALKKLPQGKTFIAGSHSGTTRAAFWPIVHNAFNAFVNYGNFKPLNACVLVLEIEDENVTLKAMEGIEFKEPKAQ